MGRLRNFIDRLSMRWYRAGIREERRRVLTLIQLVANDPPADTVLGAQHFDTCQRIATVVGEP